jgi:predicted secreted protein
VPLLACSSQLEKATITVTCDDFAQKQDIVAVAETPFAVGKSFAVALCSDSSTGFQWQEYALISDEAVVQQTAHTLSPGQDVWTFETLRTGSAMLLWSTIEGGVEQRTFRIAIAVE